MRSLNNWLSKSLAMFITIAGLWLLATTPAASQEFYIQEERGDHFYFVPEAEVRDILVVAHGTRPTNNSATETAQSYLQRWQSFAQDENLLLIVPVFDDARFGNRSGGYGGYRGLFGKNVDADDFVIDLVEQYQDAAGIHRRPFLLYGHSAGAQFAIRFLVQHPELINEAVVTAPGRYSYPDLSSPWPYGAGLLSREIEWQDGTTQSVEVYGHLESYAEAASKIHIFVGADDLAPQPRRPSHRGETRPELAVTWVSDMNRNAVDLGYIDRDDLASFTILPGVRHNSQSLITFAQSYLRDQISGSSQ